MSSQNKLRDFTSPIPEDHICPLCNLDNKDCVCVKYNCKCNVVALECIWPNCICNKCLYVQTKCECINE